MRTVFKDRLTVIVPAYNEAETLADTLRSLEKAANSGFSSRLLVPQSPEFALSAFKRARESREAQRPVKRLG